MKTIALALLFVATTAHAQRDWGGPANHEDATTLYPKFGNTAIIGITQLQGGRYAYMLDSRSCTVFSRKKDVVTAGHYFAVLADGDKYPDTERSGCTARQPDGSWVSHLQTGIDVKPIDIVWQRAPQELDRVIYDSKKGQQ